MRCMNCGADIPPAFVTAIESNTCPGCGGDIMDDQSKELMSELATALEKMPNDPQGVAGWLLSNYQFRKMGDGEGVERFHRAGQGGQASGPEKDYSNLKQDNSFDEFMERSDGGKLAAKGRELEKKLKGNKDGGGKFAEAIAAIKAQGDVYGDENEGSEITAGEEQETPVDAADQATFNEMKAVGMDPFVGGDSALGGMTTLDQSVMSQVDFSNNPLSAITDMMGEDKKDAAMLSTTEEGRRFLLKNQHKQMKAQDAFGGGGGGFRR